MKKKNKKNNMYCGLCGVEFKKRRLIKVHYDEPVITTDETKKKSRIRKAYLCQNCLLRVRQNNFMQQTRKNELFKRVTNQKGKP